MQCLSALSKMVSQDNWCKSHNMYSTWKSIRSFRHLHQGLLPQLTISLQSEQHLPTQLPNVRVVQPGKSPFSIPSALKVALVRLSTFSPFDRADEVQLMSEHLWLKTSLIPVFVTEALRYVEKVLVDRNDVVAQVQWVLWPSDSQYSLHEHNPVAENQQTNQSLLVVLYPWIKAPLVLLFAISLLGPMNEKEKGFVCAL